MIRLAVMIRIEPPVMSVCFRLKPDLTSNPVGTVAPPGDDVKGRGCGLLLRTWCGECRHRVEDKATGTKQRARRVVGEHRPTREDSGPTITIHLPVTGFTPTSTSEL